MSEEVMSAQQVVQYLGKYALILIGVSGRTCFSLFMLTISRHATYSRYITNSTVFPPQLDRDVATLL